MVTTPVKVLLFLGGGAVAAGATAFVSGALDPWIYAPPANLASVPDPATADPTPDPAAPKEERLPGTDAAGNVVPAFGLVRVEGDGSAVIAGTAVPDALVEALSAAATIGKSQSGAEGDFAIVLEEPLKPGDYQITLRSTAKGGVVALSTQTAIVSVPENKDGQVLAMIEEPGKASEIITAPTPPADVAAAEPEKPADVAVAEPEKPADVAAADPAKPAEEKPADVAAADPAAPAEEKPADVAAADPAAPVEEKPAEVAAADPAAPIAEEPAPAASVPMVVVEAVEIEGSKVFVAGAADPGSLVRVYANEFHLGDTKTTPEGRFLIEAEQELPVGNYIIRADIVSEDGSKVLARAAVPFEREPGESIAAVAPGLQQPAEEKPADVAAADPAQPAAPAEEKPADVAAAEPAAPAVPAEEKPADVAAADPAQPAAPVEEKPAEVAVADPAQPAAPAEEKPAEVAAADPTQPAAPAEEKPAEVAVADPAQPAAPAEEKPADVAAAEQPAAPAQPAEEKPADAAAAEPAQPAAPAEEKPAEAAAADPAPPAAPAEEQPAEVAVAPEQPAAPAEEKPAEVAAADPAAPAAPAEEKPADVAAADPAPAEAAAAEPSPDITAPKLQPVKSAVIIRRGDTLWRISRRVYGMGVRYSTLYTANLDQIRDPDRIWPGQVFSVPGKTTEGDEADMNAMGDQMTVKTQ